MHATAQDSSGSLMVILLFFRLLAWKLNCHFRVYEAPFYS